MGTKETLAPRARASTTRASPALGRGGTLYSGSPGVGGRGVGREATAEGNGRGQFGTVVSRVTADELQADELAWPTQEASACARHTHDISSPRGGPQDPHTLDPPNALRTLTPSTHQTPSSSNTLKASLTDLAFIVQVKFHVLLCKSQSKNGHQLASSPSCKVPVAARRGTGQVLGEPTPNSSPHTGVLIPDLSSQLSSLKSSLVLPAPLPQVPQGKMPRGPPCLSAKESSHFLSGFPSATK